ncbi:uncharacterized protein LTR77_001076 [Saxophila tyrrhenica]|uniref:Uncharacterized protein n=1 Tax=Saxophila tyrrhenica TaxID=1690608 RepID=A0AAV9PP03_9PEZI|nr:hypothetical protein LTR77_001076 [Saxophila tyrrhenica]
MKIPPAAAAWLALDTAYAIPSRTRPDVVSYDIALPHGLVVREEGCDVINTVLSTIGTSSSRVVYASTAGLSAFGVCRILRDHGIGGIGTNDCSSIALIVGPVVLSIFVATGSGADPAPTQDTEKRSSPLLLADHVHSTFAGLGFEHDGVSSVPLAPHDASSTHLPMLDHAHVKNFRHGNHTVDLHYADFGSGNGHVRISPPSTSFSSTNPEHSKRQGHDGPGFKISFTSRQPSLLTQDHMSQASYAIADDWADRADRNDPENMADYIGFQETDDTANFYYRIIPEGDGYGLEYESVDVCGGMGGYL